MESGTIMTQEQTNADLLCQMKRDLEGMKSNKNEAFHSAGKLKCEIKHDRLMVRQLIAEGKFQEAKALKEKMKESQQIEDALRQTCALLISEVALKESEIDKLFKTIVTDRIRQRNAVLQMALGDCNQKMEDLISEWIKVRDLVWQQENELILLDNESRQEPFEKYMGFTLFLANTLIKKGLSVHKTMAKIIAKSLRGSQAGQRHQAHNLAIAGSNPAPATI